MNIVNKAALFILLTISTLTIKSQEADSLKIKTYLNEATKSFISGNYRKCCDFAQKVIEIDSTIGEAYIMIGSAYINSAVQCSEDYFSKHIIFCLAVDKFQKAKELDVSVIVRAEKLIDSYSNYFPSKEEIDIDVIEGKRYKIKCWINEETTLRFSDF